MQVHIQNDGPVTLELESNANEDVNRQKDNKPKQIQEEILNSPEEKERREQNSS